MDRVSDVGEESVRCGDGVGAEGKRTRFDHSLLICILDLLLFH
jgi:hypothetical protein